MRVTKKKARRAGSTTSPKQKPQVSSSKHRGNGKSPGTEGSNDTVNTAIDYLRQGWTLMRLPPRSKEPYKDKPWAVYTITNDNVHVLTERDNLGVIFSTAGGLKDLDLDYQEAADLAEAVGLDGAAFGRKSVVGHYLFDAPGCAAKKFELPSLPEGSYPRELPLHEGKPSRMVMEIRGADNTYTMFPPSMHPCGEKLEWVGTKREPTAITANELRALAGRHAFAAVVLYFYPDDAQARYEVRMALAGALLRSGMSVDQVKTYVRAVAQLGGDERWKEDFAERTNKHLQEGKKTTGLTKLIEVLQLPGKCLDTFYEWLNDSGGNSEPWQGSSELFDPWAEYIVPKFPLEILPPVAQEFVVAQGEVIGCDQASMAMCVLGAFSGAIDHRVKLKMMRHGNWFVSPRLWVLLSGEASRKKTPEMNAATRALENYQRELLKAYGQALAAYKDTKGTDEEIEEPAPPPQYIVNDTTIEALGEILARSGRGTLIKRDEISGWLGSMEQYTSKGGANAVRGFWIQAFDGGYHSVHRIGRGDIHIDNLSVSIIGGIQPKKMAEHGLLKLTSDGLLQRFIPTVMIPGAFLSTGHAIPKPTIR